MSPPTHSHKSTQDYIPLESIPSTSKYTPSMLSSSTLLSAKTDTTTTSSRTLIPSSPFKPTSTLQIQAEGKHSISFPLPSSQLTIPIFSPSTGRPVYLSLRQTRRSGSCRLALAEDEEERTIATTTYWFGLRGNPEVCLRLEEGEETFEIKSSGMWTRSCRFEWRGETWEWRYAGRKEKRVEAEAEEMDVNNLLVLERWVEGSGEGEGKENRRRVARLIRGEDTRTPGTKRSDWGNGGRLEMRLEEEGCEERRGINEVEVVVVVTALVILKKEVDRLRGIQIAAMASGGGA